MTLYFILILTECGQDHPTTQEKHQMVTEVDSNSERKQTYEIIQVGNKKFRIKQEKSTTTSTVHAQINSEPKLRLQATLKKDISKEKTDTSKIGVMETDTERVEVQNYDDDLENCALEKNDTV